MLARQRDDVFRAIGGQSLGVAIEALRKDGIELGLSRGGVPFEAAIGIDIGGPLDFVDVSPGDFDESEGEGIALFIHATRPREELARPELEFGCASTLLETWIVWTAGAKPSAWTASISSPPAMALNPKVPEASVFILCSFSSLRRTWRTRAFGIGLPVASATVPRTKYPGGKVTTSLLASAAAG